MNRTLKNRANKDNRKILNTNNNNNLICPIKTKSQSPVQKARAKANSISLRKAVNQMCFECTDGDRADVTQCDVTGCPLHPVRPREKK